MKAETIAFLAIWAVGCSIEPNKMASKQSCIPPKEKSEPASITPESSYSFNQYRSLSCARRVAYGFGSSDIEIAEIVRSAVDQCKQYVRFSVADSRRMLALPEDMRQQIEREMMESLEAAARFHVLEVRAGTCPNPRDEMAPGVQTP